MAFVVMPVPPSLVVRAASRGLGPAVRTESSQQTRQGYTPRVHFAQHSELTANECNRILGVTVLSGKQKHTIISLERTMRHTGS